MAIQTITINQAFNAPLKDVFAALSDHETFGRLCGINMKRIVDGKDLPNGLGSVREIKIGPLPTFQETITEFAENKRIQYKITQGSPIKNHVGELNFSEQNGKTNLHYTIELESKIPLTTGIIKTALSRGIGGGLKRYANSLG